MAKSKLLSETASDRLQRGRQAPPYWGHRLAAVIIALVLSVVLVEGVLWFADIPPTGPFLQEFRQLSDASKAVGGVRLMKFKLMCFDADPSGCMDIDLRDPQQRARYARRFEPDAEFERRWRRTPHAVAVQYNDAGLRDVEFGPRRPDVWRIVVVGDSFTYGHGLPESDCYPRRLEALLRLKAPQKSLEILNCGDGAANLRVIEKQALTSLKWADPDVLVYGYFLNDPLDVADADELQVKGTRRVHDMLEVGWLNAEASSSHTRLTVGARPLRGPRVWDAVLRLAEQRRLTHLTIDWYRRLHQGPSWEKTVEVLKTIRDKSREHDCRFILIVLPLIWQINGEYPLAGVHGQIMSSARDLGIEAIDGRAALAGYTDRQLMLHPRDRHPNATYARIIAETLADALVPRGVAH